jgi:hypothetical protein
VRPLVTMMPVLLFNAADCQFPQRELIQTQCVVLATAKMFSHLTTNKTRVMLSFDIPRIG